MLFGRLALTLTLAATAALVLLPGTGSARGSHITPLPQSFCSPVFSGGHTPQALIVSDLPIRFSSRHGTTVQMQAAIRFVLERDGFKAARITVGYQACDDSSPQQGNGTVSQCAANAKAYAADPSVIGVIGTWSSKCAAVELPILDSAPGGPLALISPTNTNVGLTHADAGTDPGEPGRYYPQGVRDFFRLLPADDAQGRADAVLAHRLGAHDVYVLDDSSGYGLSVAGAFRSTAHRLRLSLAGTEAWDSTQTRFSSLVERVNASGADAVFLAGSGCPTCYTLLAELRAALGPKAPLITSDGFSFTGRLPRKLGSEAEGSFFSAPGIPLGQLGPLGQEIAHRFGLGCLECGGPPYAAEAAEVILDAISRSDGTRTSVTHALSATHIRKGILGTFGFDRNGDSTFTPILIFRVDRNQAVLNRVIVAPRRRTP
jgi:branched-chain amino acid transport system substrate-binding protein